MISDQINAMTVRKLTLASAALLTIASACADSEPVPTEAAGGVVIATFSAQGVLPVKSWKSARDHRITKQDKDFSCGAASLATLLNGHYGQNVTEVDLLKAMDKGDGRASFEDMARALPQFGFKAQGFAASWEQLTRLKVPVILYVKHRANDHFTVLRGIDDQTIWLADPSLGNRTYSKAQFLAIWETRTGAADGLTGRFLAVLPLTSHPSGSSEFFTRSPVRQSAAAMADLAHQGWRP